MNAQTVERIERALLDAVTRALPELVERHVGEAVRRVPVINGRDGRDGQDGARGEDAAPALFPVAEPWQARQYRADELSTHLGGTWQATRPTKEEPGPQAMSWIPLARGLTAVERVELADDGRLARFSFAYSDGDADDFELALPVPLHLGKLADVEDSIHKGEEIALHGCSWRARCDEPSGEPPGPDWTLVAKQGDRGKTGKPGEGVAGVELDDAGIVFVLANGERLAPVPMPPGREGPPGPPGAQGATGESGQAAKGLKWRGFYEQGKSYSPGELVKWAQRVWIATRETNEEPTLNALGWDVVMEASSTSGGAAVPPQDAEKNERIAADADDQADWQLAAPPNTPLKVRVHFRRLPRRNGIDFIVTNDVVSFTASFLAGTRVYSGDVLEAWYT